MATARPNRISNKGLDLIGAFEGFRAEPYNDPVGHATIGFGHLIHRGRVTAADRVKWGKLTRAQGLRLLRKDVEGFEKCVDKAVRVGLNQNEFDALVSFAFNVGCGAFRTSTLLRKLNAGNRRGAADELLRWDIADGVELPGLTRRRVAERKLFLTKVAPTRPAKVVLNPRNWWKVFVYGDTDVRRPLLTKLANVAQDYRKQTGQKVRIFIASGGRTYAEQTAMWDRYVRFGRPLAARPGTSNHEPRGNPPEPRAADAHLEYPNGRRVNIGDDALARKLLARRGLCLPVRGESWHVEEC